jgi:hypothetical protein
MKHLDRYAPEQARWQEVKLGMADSAQITAGDVGGIPPVDLGIRYRNGGWREIRLSTLSLVAYKDKWGGR